jgi:RNA polymerase sigma-70 factor (ECF subfamily)
LALTQTEFGRLVEDHGAALYRMAYRMVGQQHEAEDLVQETFRSAWQSRARYESGHSDRAWLASILRRRAADRWRARPIRVFDADMPEIGIEPPHPLDQQFTDEMQHALDRLPSEMRETLLLVVVGELTHQEAADVLGTPLGTVLSRVSRARAQLREHLLAGVRK